MKGPSLLSKYVGESERGGPRGLPQGQAGRPLHHLLRRDGRPGAGPSAAGGGDSHVTERVIGQFLAEMDGVEELNGVLVLGATNRPDILDPALLRPGRFDMLVEIPPPDGEGRRSIFAIGLSDRPLAKDDLHRFAGTSQQGVQRGGRDGGLSEGSVRGDP